ncbi:importin, putative [Ixodes scapularis]|uniref:Importin, putative n=1 Tax=Ixodes scapularis TaxID=6945 RepID=B7P7A4_IXOSC|nr:importin, putative [Ixodes scapularis]|eukprot:XP_002409943.1 importin, putative [Ixodes scapularis]
MLQKYGIRTRGRAVEIFSTCAQIIAAMGHMDKNTVKTLLYPILPQFTEALVEALKIPDGPSSDSGIKKEILKALTVLVKYEPKQMSTWLPHILTPVWNSLTESALIYVKTAVNDSEEANDPVDSDGEVLGFENVVFMIFDFVSALVEAPKFRGLVKKGLADLIYYIVFYMQITEEQVRTWSSSPDRFVEDEDDDTFSYSVRISAQDLLMSLFQEYEEESIRGLSAAVTKHLQESAAARSSGDPHWWKIHESCMLALGSVRDALVDGSKEHFDLSGFLESVVLADLQTSGEFDVWHPPRTRFLQTTVDGLQQTQPATLRVSAVRAVWGFCEYLNNNNQSSQLTPFLAPFAEGLITLSTQFSSDVLALAMEALSIVIAVDPQFTHSVENRVSPITIAVFLKYNSDPVLVSICQDIFKELCHNSLCCSQLQQRLLPTIISILQAPLDKIPSGIQSYGGECVRAYVSVAFDQIAAWRDDQGQSGLYYVVKIAQHLLDPKTPESAAVFVGRLVSVLITKAGPSLGEATDILLRAVLSKLQQTETLSVIQSLVLVFAHLVHTQMGAVLEFLSGVPGPTGQSALAFVLTEWCSRQTVFYGAYENKVSILALCKLLEHGIQSNDSRLVDISVKGDRIINMNEGIRTRSKGAANPEQWTEIPVMVKIYKLMIHELSNCLDNSMLHRDQDEESESLVLVFAHLVHTQMGAVLEFLSGVPGPTGQSALAFVLTEWCSRQTVFYGAYENKVSILALCKLLEHGIQRFDLDAQEEEEDPDALADPISSMNLQSCLVQFLRGLSQQPFYSTFSEHHTPQELQVLQNAGVLA